MGFLRCILCTDRHDDGPDSTIESERSNAHAVRKVRLTLPPPTKQALVSEGYQEKDQVVVAVASALEANHQ